MADPDDRELLREILRQSERVLDQQLHAAEGEDDKTRQTVALGVAVLGGGLALATLGTRGDLRWPAGGSLAAASLANLLALVSLLDAYVGQSGPEVLLLGPSPSWAASKANEASWTLADHLGSSISDLARYVEQNARVLRRVARRRRDGLRWLFTALLLYSLAAFFMLWGGLGG